MLIFNPTRPKKKRFWHELTCQNCGYEVTFLVLCYKHTHRKHKDDMCEMDEFDKGTMFALFLFRTKHLCINQSIFPVKLKAVMKMIFNLKRIAR